MDDLEQTNSSEAACDLQSVLWEAVDTEDAFNTLKQMAIQLRSEGFERHTLISELEKLRIRASEKSDYLDDAILDVLDCLHCLGCCID